MGTIGNQPERKSHHIDLEAYVMGLDQLAKDTGVPLALIIEAAKAAEAARHNDLLVQDGDFRDEHMGGLADRLRAIAEALESAQIS